MTLYDNREPTWAASLTDAALANAAKEVIESLDGMHFPEDGEVRALASRLSERLSMPLHRSIWMAVLAIKEEVMLRWLRNVNAN